MSDNKNMEWEFPSYKLSQDVKKEIISLFKRKKLTNEAIFFCDIEMGINNYFVFSKLHDMDSNKTDSDHMTDLNVAAKKILKRVKCSDLLFDAINIDYFEKKGKVFPVDEFGLMLQEFVLATDEIIASVSEFKRNTKMIFKGSKHTSIKFVCSAVAKALGTHASSYVINDREDGKLTQVMRILLEDLAYDGAPSGVVENYFSYTKIQS